MGYMLDGSLSPRYVAALTLLAEELGCRLGGAVEYLITRAAEPYLTDVDNLGLEALGFDQYGQRLKQ